MEKTLKKFSFKAFLMLSLLLFCFKSEAFDQATKSNVRDAIEKAQAVGVPTSTLNRLLAIGYENWIETTVIVNFIQILTEAQGEMIPLDPFTNKIEEGLAKRVPTPIIQQVLIKKMEDYRFTRMVIIDILKKRGMVQTIPTEYYLRLAETLACGISKENLRTIVEHAPSSSTLPMLAMAVEIVASLEQGQFDLTMAYQIAFSGLKQNYFTPERRDFARIIAIAKQKGLSDQKITNDTLEIIQKKGPLQDIAARLGVTAEDIAQGPVLGGSRSGSLGGSHAGGRPASGGPNSGSPGGGPSGGSGGGSGGR